jgi:phosphatidylserine/phosphatidylglycerophosphate/cardiolipin synthase-like enzyme
MPRPLQVFPRGRFPWREGNRFDMRADSTIFFPRMLQAIDSASQYVLLEMYLFESGAVAGRFISALIDAAGRGVQVYLLLDDFGSLLLKRSDRDRLAQPDIRLVFYNPLPSSSFLYNLYRILWRRMTHVLHRDHRKLLLVDGKVAFTGGTGITDAVEPPGNPALRWRETMVEIQGPVIGDWQQLFTDTWNHAATTALELPPATPPFYADGQRGRVTINDARRRIGMQWSLNERLLGARERIWFSTAYFIPSWRIRRKLKRAARAGIDVRLLLPGPVTDHPGARYVSRRYYGRLLRNGVRIYEYTPRFFHAKTVLCDDWITIGSSNYDRWNLQWNLEANQEIEDPRLASTAAAMFVNDFAGSHEITSEEWRRRSWRSRTLEWFWRQVEILSLRIRNRRRH